jgi:hypothetical protein
MNTLDCTLLLFIFSPCAGDMQHSSKLGGQSQARVCYTVISRWGDELGKSGAVQDYCRKWRMDIFLDTSPWKGYNFLRRNSSKSAWGQINPLKGEKNGF